MKEVELVGGSSALLGPAPEGERAEIEVELVRGIAGLTMLEERQEEVEVERVGGTTALFAPPLGSESEVEFLTDTTKYCPSLPVELSRLGFESSGTPFAKEW